MMQFKARVTETAAELNHVTSQRLLTTRAQMSHVSNVRAARRTGEPSPTLGPEVIKRGKEYRGER
jgi:hypothetical protein